MGSRCIAFRNQKGTTMSFLQLILMPSLSVSFSTLAQIHSFISCTMSCPQASGRKKWTSIMRCHKRFYFQGFIQRMHLLGWKNIAASSNEYVRQCTYLTINALNTKLLSMHSACTMYISKCLMSDIPSANSLLVSY